MLGRRTRLRWLAPALAILAAILATAGLIQWEPWQHLTTSRGRITSPTPSTPSSTPPKPPAAALPRSTPLTYNQLVVPVLVDGTYDIYLADVTNNAPVRPLIKRPGNDTGVSISPDRASPVSFARSRRVSDWLRGALCRPGSSSNGSACLPS
jgi:hypothetical protein